MSDADKTVMFKPGAATAANEAASRQPKAKLVCLDDSILEPAQKGLVIELEEGREQIAGRSKDNPICIQSIQVSRSHAAFYPVDGEWGIKDLNSSNGVFVNGNRVNDARLASGDTVKLGAIPFRFEIERASPASSGTATGMDRFRGMDDEEVEKTMMFGDVRASSKLLAAQEASESPDAAATAPTEPDRPAARPAVKPAVKPTKRRVQQQAGEETTVMNFGMEQQPAKKFPVVKAAFFALAGVIVVVGIYFGFGMLKESSIVESKRDAVNRFVRDAATAEDPRQFGEERKTLAKLRQDLLDAIAEAPDKPELGVLLERVIILEFERTFYEAIAAANYSAARDAIASTQRRLAGIRRKPDGSVALGVTLEGENLLAVMAPTIAFMEFAKAYPDPKKKAAVPDKALLDDLLRQKSEFTKMQRTANMDLVRHPYLTRMLEQGNQDIRLVERWEAELRTAAK